MVAWLPWIALGAFAALWAARWPGFPLSLDPYYHLLIARQVVDAGGPLAYEWWELAPVGRPHLYPPLLHLLLALLLKIGLSPVAVIRLASVTLPVALLVSLYVVSRRLAGPSTALAALGAALTPFAFHLHCAITLAATVGMVELLWLFAALEERRPLAAGCLLGLLCYTHLGLPGIALIVLLSHAAVRGEAAWRALGRASWGLLLVVPWWLHLFRARPGLQVTARLENVGIEVMPVMLLAAAAGLGRCWRFKGTLTWFAACWAGFLALAPRHSYRWLNGEGMLPLLLLAGVGIERVVERAAQGRGRRRVAAGLLAGLVLLLAPALVRTDEGWDWRWPDAAPWHLMGSPLVIRKERDATFLAPPVRRLAAMAAAQTQPSEILWSNAPYALGLIAALAHRPMSSAMFNEVGPSRPFDPIAAAHLVVFFKVGRIPGWVSLTDLRPYALRPVAEDEVAILYRRSGGTAEGARPPQAAVPLAAAVAGLALLLGLCVWDFARGQVHS